MRGDPDDGIHASLRGDWGGALALFRASAQGLTPSVAYLNNLGVAYLGLKKYWRAAVCFRRALRLDPESAPVIRHLGKALWALGNGEAALSAYRNAVCVAPDHVQYRTSLAATLLSMGYIDEALVHARCAAGIAPADSDVACLLADCLKKANRICDAATTYQRIIETEPQHLLACNNLGGLRAEQGRLGDAVYYFRKAAMTSGAPDVHSNVLMTLHYDVSAPEAIFAEHQKWAALHYPAQAYPVHANDRTPDRRLRIGYVSGDFRDHSVALLFEPILANHDPRKVEVLLYSTAMAEDVVTSRLRSHGGAWHRVSSLSDARAASLIASHEIDILVDLSGHTAGNRLGIFANKPAPVQATYCGYADTTGLPAIDWRITDEFCDPSGQTEHLHSERLYRLRPGFLCFRPPEYAPPVSSLPSVQTGRITFGCFAIRPKITDEMLGLWASILLAAADSRLVIKNRQVGDPEIANSIRARLSDCGVDGERVEFRGYSPRHEHIRDHADIDIMLDTFPYCGTVATCESLWMGVPVLTLAGKSHISRVGLSLLTRLGMADWVARSREEYVLKAIRFASDSGRLKETRALLRQGFARSSLGDPVEVTRSLENAYRAMWLEWLALPERISA